MGSPIEFLTLNTSEFPNEGVESSLLDVLTVIGEVPQRYYLTPRASRGILRRADKRGRKIAPSLRLALQTRADLLEEE